MRTHITKSQINLGKNVICEIEELRPYKTIISQIGHGTARALHAPRVSRCCLPLPLSPPPSPLSRAALRVGHPRRQRRRRLVMYLPRPYPAQRPLLPLPFFFLEQSSNELEQLAFRRPNPWPPLHPLQITRTRSSLTSLAPSPAPWN